jgi:hypothetical protein
MQVRLVQAVSGFRDGASWPPVGSVVEVPDGEGADLIAAGIAADPADVVETASAAAPEQAAETGRRKPRREE